MIVLEKTDLKDFFLEKILKNRIINFDQRVVPQERMLTLIYGQFRAFYN